VNVKHLIRRKRRGEALGGEEIDSLIRGYMAGDVPDYQMSALLMAIVWQGMSEEETFALTRAMVASGRTMSWDDLTPTADKHSTGGVGDKVSLALAPLAASAGVYVPMLSGRGLGHTGGTLDKLEAIPGFTARLDGARFARVLREVGCVMGGQSEDLAPADGRIYALRDATETVESLPLIVSSILSKKVAAGPRALVLDVKVGRGAFMEDLARATELARLLVATSTRMGLSTLAFLTDMDVPLGRAVGNALETNEAIDVLCGVDVSEDLHELTLLLTSAMLVTSHAAPTLLAAKSTLLARLASGAARDVFIRLIEAQGGDARAAVEGRLPVGRSVPVPAESSGVVSDVDPLAIARVVIDLGGGRRRVTDAIDPSVGVFLSARPNERVRRGEPLAVLHLPAGAANEAAMVARVRNAFTLGGARRTPLVHAVVGAGGVVPWRGWDTVLPLA
jgi:pyrimidine-nucleoside phosphorylase